MKRFLLFLIVLFSAPLLRATHNIAGEITLTCLGGLNYKVTITTYTNMLSPADRCDLNVEWGDGVVTIANRVNNMDPNGSCYPAAGMGRDLTNQGYPNVKQNIYESTHVYWGAGTYNIVIKDPNRVASIINIPNSVNVPFYLSTTLVVNPLLGCNSTPILTTYPLDKACIGHCYYHNPGAVDPDGDSLSYDIGNCLDTNGQVIVGYIPLSSYGGVAIDHVTGDLSWCSPTIAGKYNLIISVTEWKRMPDGTRINIGTVYRDMSIDVISNCTNDNPEIPDIPDLCVDAGDTVNFTFNVTDPNSGDKVKLEGFGGPFTVTPAATITPNTIYILAPYAATFNWVTNCDRVRLQPWIVTLKATDNDTQVPLTDIESVNITVVSPGPAFLTVVPSGSSISLNWGTNPCDPSPNPCVGYKIYRRQGPSGWNHAPCETGVPSYTGFVQIGTVVGINNTTFVDNNLGQGLVPGVDYCYRVCAYFIDAAESYASPENCAELLRDIPVLTNVDVMNTGSNNQIWVGWQNALANGVDFDTLLHPGPWRIDVYRFAGSTFSQSTATLISTVGAAIFNQIPTSVIDNGLSTITTSYSYRLAFWANNGLDSIGSCQPASSVFLSAAPADNRVLLNWVYNVPWMNTEAAIYRFNSVTLLWDSLTTSPGDSYIDDSLQNGVQYCYFVTTHGTYNNASLPPVLYNRSQETCATPMDLTPPCAPVLVINSDCYIGLNQLIWTNPMNMNCGTDDVVQYNIWYTETEGGTMQVIATVNVASDTVFNFTNLTSVAGCYAITALDTFNNQSALSNIFCVDNCPSYELPNVFSPNGDGTNDFFIPFPYRYIKDVDIKIYDRWGMLIFETTDPDVRWDGRDMTTHKLCTDGVYYYTCVANEIHLEGIVPRELKGFVHLFGKDIGQFH